ncbi:hypothetical protein HANVADRAFT_48812 [Hanseniaspora valbyensis NRRL Y-1626]|uniref:DNA-directed RNA polymerase I subunit RPA34 n=1 Tax=Hanseniaspora valbyensis NRRL Y-1626 TaxID=766949 RepID=A0A1B7TDD4_9ASCO|nr:hypothetical protein HANVADRAFT_48812 [Hanseniaspora valbyensis NRRL Y-1626]
MAKEYKSKEYISDSDSDSDSESPKSIFQKEFKTYKVTKLSKVPSSFQKNIINKKKSSKSKQKLVIFKIPKSITIDNVDIFQSKQKEIKLVTKDDSTYELKEDSLVNTENLKLIVNGDNAEGTLIPQSDDVLSNIKCYSAVESVEIPKIDFEASRIPRENVVQIDNMKQEHFATGYDAKDYVNDKENQSEKKQIESEPKKEKKEKRKKGKKREEGQEREKGKKK